MRRVVGGKRYDTETAILIADDTYRDGGTRRAGECATFLLRTPRGAYFALHETCWQGERVIIEPLTLNQAVTLYETLSDSRSMDFELAFPDVTVEEA